MLENLQGSYTLANCNAAISADVKGGNILTADGINKMVWKYNRNGNLLDEHCTLRPYTRFRYNKNARITTALGCCNSNNVYVLDDNLNELGYITLNGLQRNNCSSYGALTDASVTLIGTELFFVGAFADGAFLFDCQGQRLTRLCSVEKSEVLTDFIAPGNDIFAMATLCGTARLVTVSDSGTLYSGILAPKYTLRMLFYDNNCIYGLFGQGYIYNRIVKIYSCGNFSLPR